MPQDNWENAKEVQSNWFKFNNVGDKIKGTLTNKAFQESSDNVYSDQWVYDLLMEDKQTYKVGVSTKKQGTIDRLNKCEIGEIIGIVFDSETEPKQKGFHPTKNLKIFTFGMNDAWLSGGLSEDKPDNPF